MRAGQRARPFFAVVLQPGQFQVLQQIALSGAARFDPLDQGGALGGAGRPGRALVDHSGAFELGRTHAASHGLTDRLAWITRGGLSARQHLLGNRSDFHSATIADVLDADVYFLTKLNLF